MKAIRAMHSFFQEESLKIKNDQAELLHTAIVKRYRIVLRVS